MKYSILFAIGIAMILPLQAAEKSAKKCHKAHPQRVFNRKDKDHDHMLTQEEFVAKAKKADKAAKRFTKRDKDSDGKLTFAEFTGKKAKKAGKANKAKKSGKTEKKAERKAKRGKKAE